MFGRGGKRNAERIEPRLDDSPRGRGRGDDLRADPADRPQRRPKKASRGSGGGRRGSGAKPRRSLVGRLVYWGFVLAVWGVVGVAGLFAYYASQLPPIDQLAVP
jgi:penicillin-binding protein 1A